MARKVVDHLENRGANVYSIFAMRSLKGFPFAGLDSLDLGQRHRASGIVGLSDVLSGLLAQQGPGSSLSMASKTWTARLWLLSRSPGNARRGPSS
ncbi:conserved hypothetical protein [Arthrobacter sp. Hiyo8]|nr:conserved hypothetical protein [Arthrobacter sp. Hiyo8]